MKSILLPRYSSPTTSMDPRVDYLRDRTTWPRADASPIPADETALQRISSNSATKSEMSINISLVLSTRQTVIAPAPLSVRPVAHQRKKISPNHILADDLPFPSAAEERRVDDRAPDPGDLHGAAQERDSVSWRWPRRPRLMDGCVRGGSQTAPPCPRGKWIKCGLLLHFLFCGADQWAAERKLALGRVRRARLSTSANPAGARESEKGDLHVKYIYRCVIPGCLVATESLRHSWPKVRAKSIGQNAAPSLAQRVISGTVRLPPLSNRSPGDAMEAGS
jgi:hypothetical protein